MHPQNLGRWWRTVRGSLGLDGVVIHELRHTCLTLLASGGAGFQTLKDLAGWADVETANTYIHTDDSANRATVSTVENMIEFSVLRRCTS